jgi:hypothetical protein
MIVPDLPGHGASVVLGGVPDARRVLDWLGEALLRAAFGSVREPP